MTRPATLSDDELAAAMAGLPGWSLVDATLRRAWQFPDFAAAFGFMSAVAVVAAEMDHHPDWSNVYSRVSVALSTHDAGGVTELDLQLAGRMDELAAAMSGAPIDDR